MCDMDLKLVKLLRTNRFSINGKYVYYDSLYGHLKLGELQFVNSKYELINECIKDECRELRILAIKKLKELIKEY